MIAASVAETDWMDRVAKINGPWCFISEAAIIYLEESQVRQTLGEFSQRFKGAWFLNDTAGSKMVRNQHRHDSMKKLPKESGFKWECDNPESLFDWGLELISSKTLLHA